jgi:CBS domain-containing protein
MQVREAMSDDVRIANPNQSIRDAATLMAQIDAGVLPVGENDRLVGIITDRDIAVRAIALGKGPDTPIREVMSEHVKYCFEDDDVDDVAQKMAGVKVRRLPVLNRQALGRYRRSATAWPTARPMSEALCDISAGGAHCNRRTGDPGALKHPPVWIVDASCPKAASRVAQRRGRWR